MQPAAEECESLQASEMKVRNFPRGLFLSVFTVSTVDFSVDSSRLILAVDSMPAGCCEFPSWHGALGRDGYENDIRSFIQR